jgi:hypothetical protein
MFCLQVILIHLNEVRINMNYFKIALLKQKMTSHKIHSFIIGDADLICIEKEKTKITLHFQ